MIKEIEGPCPEGVQHLSTSQTHHISSLSPNERKKDEEGEEREGDGMTEKKTSFRWADEKCIDEEEEEEDNPSVYFNEMEGHNKRSISNFCFSSSSYPSYSPSGLRGGCSSPPVSSLSSSSFSSSRDFMAHRCHSPSTQHPAIPSSPSPLSSPGASYHCSSEKNQVPKRSPGKADEGGKSRRPRRRRKKTSIPASTMPTSSYPPSLNKDTSSSPSCSSSSFAGQTVYDTHRHPNLERDICLSSTFPSDFLPCSSSSSISSFDLPSASPPASHESIRCSSSSPRMPVLPISPPSPPSASSSSLLPNSDQSSFPSYPYFYWFLPSYLPCHQITCESTIPSSVTQFSPIHPLFFSSSCAPLLTPSGSFSSPGSSYSPPLLSSCLLSTSFASPSQPYLARLEERDKETHRNSLLISLSVSRQSSLAVLRE
ncbi:hypothetical protein CSUI_009756 [Cystoisospora suis]|uniref:Uncharacterized protein n=1 Tax=Cystoisospora suis TaxID=483139 RepID=A0A2C6K1R3_9APIC|nr:hypothetical protein CSUI_009756 [Cystoisospora suis]